MQDEGSIHGENSPTVSQNTGPILPEKVRNVLKKIAYAYAIFFHSI